MVGAAAGILLQYVLVAYLDSKDRNAVSTSSTHPWPEVSTEEAVKRTATLSQPVGTQAAEDLTKAAKEKVDRLLVPEEDEGEDAPAV